MTIQCQKHTLSSIVDEGLFSADPDQKNLRRNPLENRVIILTSGQKSHHALRATL